MNDDLQYSDVKKDLMKIWKEEFDLKLQKMKIHGKF